VFWASLVLDSRSDLLAGVVSKTDGGSAVCDTMRCGEAGGSATSDFIIWSDIPTVFIGLRSGGSTGTTAAGPPEARLV
jgi:hypothetical protein